MRVKIVAGTFTALALFQVLCFLELSTARNDEMRTSPLPEMCGRCVQMEEQLAIDSARLADLEERIIRLEHDKLEAENHQLVDGHLRSPIVQDNQHESGDPADGEESVRVHERLRSLDAKTRLSALLELRETGLELSRVELEELLGDDAPLVRRQAVSQVVWQQADGLSGVVAGLLSDEDSRVRESAAEALGELGARSAVPSLLRSLHDINEPVRGLAMTSLGLLGAGEAHSAIRDIYDDDPGSNRLLAAEALRRLGDPQPFQDEVLRVERLSRSPDPIDRVRGIRLMEGFAPDQALRIVSRVALEDPHDDVRREARECLEHLQREQEGSSPSR